MDIQNLNVENFIQWCLGNTNRIQYDTVKNKYLLSPNGIKPKPHKAFFTIQELFLYWQGINQIRSIPTFKGKYDYNYINTNALPDGVYQYCNFTLLCKTKGSQKDFYLFNPESKSNKLKVFFKQCLMVDELLPKNYMPMPIEVSSLHISNLNQKKLDFSKIFRL